MQLPSEKKNPENQCRCRPTKKGSYVNYREQDDMQLYRDAFTQKVLHARDRLRTPDSYHAILTVHHNTVGAKGNHKEMQEDRLPRNKEQIRKRL